MSKPDEVRWLLALAAILASLCWYATSALTAKAAAPPGVVCYVALIVVAPGDQILGARPFMRVPCPSSRAAGGKKAKPASPLGA